MTSPIGLFTEDKNLSEQIIRKKMNKFRQNSKKKICQNSIIKNPKKPHQMSFSGTLYKFHTQENVKLRFLQDKQLIVIYTFIHSSRLL